MKPQFGVTRHHIRELLAKLEAYGFVVVRPKARAVVTKNISSFEKLALLTEVGSPIDLERARQALEVRRIIEVSAIGLAAHRIQKENLEELGRILEASSKKIARRKAINEEDELFHMEIVRSTQNKILEQTVSLFYSITRQQRRRYFSSQKRCRASHAEHKQLFLALKRGDGVRAERAMEDHLEDASSYWSVIANMASSGGESV